MNLSRTFILRPVATSLLMLAMLIAGIFAYRLLPVAALPQVDYPIIQITTLYPGASPTVTTSAVTAPLERRLGQIPGLKQMSSTSSGGASVITLQFALEVDLGVAEQEVQAAINAANSFLPGDLPLPPVYRKVNPADTPIITLAITADGLSLPQVYDLVDTRMAQRLSQLPGVGMVSIAGGQRPAVRIQVNPQQLAATGLGMADIRRAISAANVNLPKGSFDGPTRAIMLDANDQLRSVDEYRNLVLSYRDGAPLRLGDVASVEQGPENRQLAAWSGKTPAILLNIQRQPGANVIGVVDSIHALLPQLRSAMPAAVTVSVLSDRTESIRASIKGVQHELVLAIGLVVLVTFVFLRTIPATIIPSIAVPLSLIGTFAVMLLAGYSLNNLTLMALTIATGFVVDDAIVMLENIARHMEMGKSRLQAALDGARQIGFTLISLTVSLIAVLIPLLFMGDVVGKLFHEFAITLAVAIGLSLVVSLTLTPMLCARFLKANPHAAAHGEGAAQGDIFDRVVARYDRGLHWVLARQPLMLIATVATLVLTAALYLAVPKGFFPVQDAGLVQGISEAPQSISFQAMSRRQQALADAVLEDADVASVSSFIGVDGANATLNSGRLLIELKPHGERDAGAQEIIARLQQRVDRIPGISLYLQPVQELSIEDRISRTQYQFVLTTPDADELALWSGRLLEHLQQQPALRDVASDLANRGLQAYVDIDRDAAARLGVPVSSIADALYDAFGQRQISTIFTHANQYRVVLEAHPAQQLGPEDIGRIHVSTADGQQTPLAGLARISTRATALQTSHLGQFPAVTLSFNLAQGASLGEAVAAIEGARKAIGMPASVELRLQGAAAAFENSLSSTLWLILAAVLVMYIVLGVLYESFIHPVTILSTLPSATVGALAALLISGRSLDLIAVIGIILLIGLVKKNAIMMIDFALEAQREHGMSPQQAIHQAALLRFRPILMTTLAALFAAVPMMFATGSGAELRQPLGLVMVGGLVVSQVLTLFTTPVIYLFFNRFVRGNGAGTVDAESGGGLSMQTPHTPEPLNLSRTFILRPVATGLLAIAVVLAGILAFFRLPVAPLPQVDYPAIQVSASLPGASPESMAATVATPLERALGTIPGVTRLTSSSNQGNARIDLQFSLERNVDEAAREVQAAINAARAQLPAGMPGMPQYRKINPSQAPVLILALSSASHSPGEIYDVASTVIAQKIAQVPGVGQVEAGGSSLPAVRVSLNPNALNQYGIALDDVAGSIRNANALRPLGQVASGDRQWQVEASLQLRHAAQYQDLVVAMRDGRPVHLRDVAQVSDGTENRYAAGFHNNNDAVLLIVSRQPSANIIATVDAIHAQMDTLTALLPDGMQMNVVMDRSPVIRATLREAELTLVLAVALVVLVVLAFLGHWRAALIPTLAIPVSLFGALFLIWLWGFSLNTFSLMALIVAAVLVVDDAIVVLENIARHIEEGLSPLKAAITGAREVGATLLSMNLALAVVFVSILFMDDFVKRLFGEFSLTLVAAMAVSLLVSISLTPALCARLLRAHDPQRVEGPWQRLGSLAFDGLRAAYLRSLGACLRHVPLMLCLLVAVIALNVLLLDKVPRGTIPQQDSGQLRGFMRGDDGLSFQVMQPKIAAYRQVLMNDPAVAQIGGFIGGGTGVNNGMVMVQLKPLDQRDVSAREVVDRIRASLPKVPGGNMWLSVDQDIRVGGGGGNDDGNYDLQLLAADIAPLREWTPRLQQALAALPELEDVESSGDEGMRQVKLEVDREKASQLGVDMRLLSSVLNNSFSQRQVATLYDSLNQYRVVMELDPRYTQSPTTLEQVNTIAADGSRVPLSSFARWDYGMAPDRIQHREQFLSTRISFALAAGVTLGQASTAIEKAVAGVMLPSSVQAKLGEEAGSVNEMRQRQLWLILGAALAVYLVLGVLYESSVLPLAILSTLPSAGVGALLALLLFGNELNLISLLGLFLLVGVVMKNTILMVDFAIAAQREQGLDPQAAMLESARLRFRPILMTSVAALLGTLPLMLATGEGWEMRQPLGIAIVGGLLVSQWLTLYTTPAIYLALARLRARFVRTPNVLAQHD